MAGEARAVIEQELRLLRKLAGALDETKLLRTRLLVRALAGGDRSLALVRLRTLLRNYSASDRDIAAAAATIDGDGGTVLDRLEVLASDHFVDARTARRWSDDGIRKISQLLLTTEPWIQPILDQWVIISPGRVEFGLDLRVPAGVAMRPPTVLVDGAPLDVGMPPVEHKDVVQDLSSTLITLCRWEDLPLRISVRWPGEAVPRFIVRSSGHPEVVCAARVSMSALETHLYISAGHPTQPPATG